MATSTNFETLDIRRDGPVDWLTLNRPDRLNTITGTMVAELNAYFAAKADDLNTRVIVMKGAGNAFCAGLDIKEQHTGGDQVVTGSSGPQLADIPVRMRACPQPIVALLHGPACGGGFAFALAADIRIAGESTRMNDAFIRIGMSGCELGLSWALPRLVGLSVARELMYTGRFIEAERALRVGLVSEVVPDADLESAGQTLVDDMLRNAPTGLRLTKKTLEAALAIDDLESVIALESRTQGLCQATGDFEEAMAAFLEKRPPQFAGA